MATLFEYKCKNCEYSKSVTLKGHDMILYGDLYTYLYEDCKQIVDVLYQYWTKPKKLFALNVALRILEVESPNRDMP